MTDVAAHIDTQPWTPEDTFGARLALIRQRFHWNVSEAARATGISAATWTTWEEGSMPRDFIGTCEKIADKTGCSMMWLVGGGHHWKLMMGADQPERPNLTLAVSRKQSDTRPEQGRLRLLHSVPAPHAP